MKYFRILSYAEAVSLLVLFLVAMPLKYFLGMPEATRIAGTIHGVLFLMFIYTSISVGRQHGWTLQRIMGSWVIASLPLGPVLFEKKLFEA